ncbi:MAG: pSer/pThr/pTyr-binding forkhead associated (FHA) protein [Kiritimatiellia bacterium]|jgi:pSer/pThr/pTyr-binding forkhead associated (FHA) protein
MSDVPVLVCTAGQLKGTTVLVPEEGTVTMGRAADDDVIIHDDGVSRYHARLLYNEGSLWLRDAGSRNGVFVNGKRVTDHKALKVGDIVTLSAHTFEVRWQGDLDDPPRDDSETVEKAKTESTKPWYWPF